MIDNEIGNGICADSLGFLAPPLEPPFVRGQLAVDVVLTTSASPSSSTKKGVPPSLAQTIGENHKFTETLLDQEETVHLVRRRKDLDIPGFIRVIRGLQCPPGDVAPCKAAKELWRKGIRVVNLSGYEGEHPFGAGFAEPEIKLKEKGKDFVRACADIGLIADFAHMSLRCMWDTLNLIDRENLRLPIMASHVGCWSVYEHYRNLPDSLIAEIFKRGGYMGVAGMTPFLSKDDETMKPFIDHLTHALGIAQRDGGYLGFGSGAVYRDWSMEKACEHWSKVLGIVAPDSDHLEVADRLPPFPEQWITQGTQIPYLIQEELRRLWVPYEIRRGLLGKNFVDFLKKALPA